MTPIDFTYPSADDVVIHARRWNPDGTPRGIVQIAHGMGEHISRYDPLAVALAARGFVAAGQDHRGHGSTAGSPDRYGHLGAAGWQGLVDDIGRLSATLRADAPDIPLVLLGHSMGSFAAQQYAFAHSADISALALTGTAALDLLEPGLKLDQPLELEMFNAPFSPARTDFDWLSRDEAQVDLYVDDPQCGFGLDAEATKQMFVAARALAGDAQVGVVRGDLPVYLAVGDRDPVNAQLALVDPLVARYLSTVEDVTVHVYPEARHEVLNETNRDEVFADLFTWLDRIVPA